MLSAVGVVWTLHTNRSIARKRAALDILLMEQTNPVVIAERTKYAAVRDSGMILQWAAQLHATSPERRSIRTTLNHAEFVAVGIKEKTLDGELYKRSWRSTYVKDWIDLKPFVMEIRRTTGVPTLLCEYEARVRKWANSAERRHI